MTNIRKLFKRIITIKLKRDIKKYLYQHGSKGIFESMHYKYSRIYSEIDLKKILFIVMKDISIHDAVKFGEEVLYHTKDPGFARVLAERFRRINDIAKSKVAINIAEKLELSDPTAKYNTNVGKSISKQEDADFKVKLLEISVEHPNDADKIKVFLNNYVQEFNKTVFAILKDSHPKLAVDYGINYYYVDKDKFDVKFACVLLLRVERLGLYDKAIDIIKDLLNAEPSNSFYMDKLVKFIKISYGQKILAQKEHYERYTLDLLSRIIPGDILDKELLSYRIIFELMKDNEELYESAAYFANECLNKKKDPALLYSLFQLHFYNGHITRALDTIKGQKLDKRLQARKSIISAFSKFLDKGYKLPTKKSSTNQLTIPNKNVLYCLHNSLPYNSGGYATRSHGVAKGVQANGWNIQVVSRLGYPYDLSNFKGDVSKINESATIDNIHYHRLFHESVNYKGSSLDVYLEKYCKMLTKLSSRLDISILHGASNFLNGIAVNYAAKSLGVKSIYEVRGLWEITRMSRQPLWEDSEHFKMIKRLETEAAMNADAVITLTEALKNEMIERGVDSSKITVISNGVDSKRFSPADKSLSLQSEFNYQNKIIIGYIGSVVDYEGLEYLVKAVQILDDRGLKNIAVMIVGDGVVLSSIQEMTKECGVENIFNFVGRVKFEEVDEYYSLIDILVFPRKALPVCEMVSPIKPFEAMSLGKVTVGSNVAALAEIINHRKTGLLFAKENSEDLADKLSELIHDAELRDTLGKNAREWIKKHKDWDILTEQVSNIYSGLYE